MSYGIFCLSLSRLIAINRGGAPFLENLSDQSDPAMFGMDPKLEAPKPSQTGKRLHAYRYNSCLHYIKLYKLIILYKKCCMDAYNLLS